MILKRFAFALSLLLITSLASAATKPKATWTMQGTADAAYVGRHTTDATGKESTKFEMAGLTGLAFWRTPATGSIGFGLALQGAALLDEGESLPRFAPGFSLQIGTSTLHAQVGALYDPQDAKQQLLPIIGFGASFGGGQ